MAIKLRLVCAIPALLKNMIRNTKRNHSESEINTLKLKRISMKREAIIPTKL